eukprot:23829-Rhodomonas_salina.1
MPGSCLMEKMSRRTQTFQDPNSLCMLNLIPRIANRSVSREEGGCLSWTAARRSRVALSRPGRAKRVSTRRQQEQTRLNAGEAERKATAKQD